ncbi:MAG: FlgO family outer membrane protein [bacterium]
MKKICTCLVMAVISLYAGRLNADPLESLTGKMAKKIKDYPNKKIAVLSFPYHNGYISSGSTLVQERFTTFFAAHEDIEVIERNLLNKILEELKLEQTGVIDTGTTKELGKLLGVSAVVTGTLNDLKKDKTEVNARIIDTQSGKILAAGRKKINRTWTDFPVLPAGTVMPPDKPADPDPNNYLGEALVQLAILLDTSSSMNGLILQAKTQLWKIVNELASSEKDGENPTIQVALYEYGNSGLAQSENYIRRILGFTTNLDTISESLFALTTNGGQEYCGAVISDAAGSLQWDTHTDVYKAVFIAGNEQFTQGPIDFRKAVQEAVNKGIYINTIYCGQKQRGIAEQWHAGAEAGNGEYLNIDQDVKIVSIPAPQDTKIEQLGKEYNKTYIPYGSEGKKESSLRKQQDKKAEAHSAAGASVERSLFKATKQYSKSSPGDLVNEIVDGRLDADEIELEKLPAELKSKSQEELKTYIAAQQKERERIQYEIKQLKTERDKYIADKRKEQAEGGTQTLDSAILNAVRTQATQKNFRFK